MAGFGVPGPGGSLGKCCYCGDTFLREVLDGTNCKVVGIGGQQMALHDRDDRRCFDELQKICAGETLALADWPKLPEASPLRAEMKKMAERIEKEVGGGNVSV